jgi:hypothetical protein
VAAARRRPVRHPRADGRPDLTGGEHVRHRGEALGGPRGRRSRRAQALRGSSSRSSGSAGMPWGDEQVAPPRPLVASRRRAGSRRLPDGTAPGSGVGPRVGSSRSTPPLSGSSGAGQAGVARGELVVGERPTQRPRRGNHARSATSRRAAAMQGAYPPRSDHAPDRASLAAELRGLPLGVGPPVGAVVGGLRLARAGLLARFGLGLRLRHLPGVPCGTRRQTRGTVLGPHHEQPDGPLDRSGPARPAGRPAQTCFSTAAQTAS